MKRRLPVRISVAATYETFFAAPIAFTLVSIAGLSGFVATFDIGMIAVHNIEAGGADISWAMRAAAPLAYFLFIFCMGVQCLLARQLRRAEPWSVAAAAAGSLRRSGPALLASIHIFVTFGLFLYGTEAFGSLSWLLASCAFSIADLTVLALVMPICFIERLGPIASLARSLRLTRGSVIRLYVAVFIAGFPISLAGALLETFGNSLVTDSVRLLSIALSYAAISIQSVVALDLLDPPAGQDRTDDAAIDEALG